MAALGRIGQIVRRCVAFVAIVVATMVADRGYANGLWHYGDEAYLNEHDSFMFAGLERAEREDVVCDGDPEKVDYILISKEHQTLSLIDTEGRTICCYPASVGANYGNKQRPGDLKTTEGVFSVERIQNASWWGHDSKDGNGFIENCYGNWFIRVLAPPHRGIGIHATLRRHNIGTRASEGCITIASENLDKLRPLVRDKMKIIIETSIRDMAADGRCHIVFKRFGKEYSMINPSRYRGELQCNVVQDHVEHVVKNGDTHLSLAIKYCTSHKAIEALNPGVNLNRLAVGQKITVCGSFSVVLNGIRRNLTFENAGPKYYTATSVETFGRIAVMHATNVSIIQHLNPHISPDSLVAGMRVRVR